jgi:hypothetical protein
VIKVGADKRTDTSLVDTYREEVEGVRAAHARASLETKLPIRQSVKSLISQHLRPLGPEGGGPGGG